MSTEQTGEQAALPALSLPAYFKPRERVETLWVVSKVVEPDVPRPLHLIEVRRCFAGSDVTLRSATCEKFVDLEQARATLAGRGLSCIGRMPDDEPELVEVWQ